MLELAALAVVTTGFLVMALSRGLWATLYCGMLLSVVFATRLTSNSTVSNTGIAASSPEIWTYSLVILAGAGLLLFSGKSPIPSIFLPFVGLLIFGYVFWWPVTSTYVQAGMLQLLGGVAAWSVGSAIARQSMTSRSGQHLIVNAALCIVLLELAVGLAQFAGLDINSLSSDMSALMGSRVNGTMNHPNNLGKVLVLLMIILSLFTQSEDSELRRKATIAILSAIIPLAMTGGRAVFIAGIAVVLISHIASPRTRNRYGLPIGMFVIALPFLGGFVSRFADDPEGGSRPHMTALALEQISRDPLSGVGPNMYVYVVGQTDELTARGLPVHNGFLLVLSELGIFGLASLFGPFFWLAWKAWKSRQREGDVGAAARSYLSAVPALAIVVGTGWGMLSGPYLYLWFFTIGFVAVNFTHSMSVSRTRPWGKRKTKEPTPVKVLYPRR